MKSIIQNEKECFLCRRFYDVENLMWLECHHVFGGANRNLSERYGLKIYLCHNHHNEKPLGVHHNKDYRILVKQIAQSAFERQYSHGEFMKIFGKNYLE